MTKEERELRREQREHMKRMEAAAKEEVSLKESSGLGEVLENVVLLHLGRFLLPI